MNALAKNVTPRAPATIDEQLEILRRAAQRGLSLAQRRDRVFVDIFQHLIDELERTAMASQPASALDDSKVRYHDDCQRIQTVLRVYCGEQRTLRECERLWVTHSDGTAANWLRLPADDEELAVCVSSKFPSNDHDILSR